MDNKVVLITGGASGIGKATAMKLVSQGTTVIISGRREETGLKAVAEIQAVAKDNAQVRFIRNDVSNEEDVKNMINQVVSEFGRLDMAVNNAGISNETSTINLSSTDLYLSLIHISEPTRPY